MNIISHKLQNLVMFLMYIFAEIYDINFTAYTNTITKLAYKDGCRLNLYTKVSFIHSGIMVFHICYLTEIVVVGNYFLK